MADDLIKFWCIHCDARLKVKSNKASQDLTCPACKEEVTVPEKSTMTIGHCMHCGQRSQHYESSFPNTDFALGQVTCVKCEKWFAFYRMEDGTFSLNSVVPATKERLQSLVLPGGSIEKEPTVERQDVNQRSSNCYYCGCSVLKGEGVMKDVPSVKSKAMRRTICLNCEHIPNQEWGSVREAVEKEDDMVYLAKWAAGIIL